MRLAIAVLALIVVSGCIKELTPTEKCALKGEVFAGHIGEEIRCDLPPGRQDACVIDAMKKEANAGLVAFGYRWLDTEKRSAERDLNLLLEIATCNFKYPCGTDDNGPCAKK